MNFRRCARWGGLLGVVACSVYDEGLLALGSGGAAGTAGAGSGDSGGQSGGAGSTGAGSGGMAAGSGAGSGGSGGIVAPAGSTGASDGGAGGEPFVPMFELIDDLEDTNTTVAYIDERDGRWVTDNDGSGTTTPPKTSFALLVSELTGTDAREGSTYGVRLRAEGFQAGAWGAFVGLYFLAPDSTPYDASAYCGIHFWAKRSTDTAPVSSIEIRIPDQYSVPSGGFCVETPEAAGGAGGAAPGLCYDHHAEVLNITSEWAEYTIYFSDMQQGNWFGYEQSPLAGLDVSTITSIQFFMSHPQVYELWVDDVSFINKPVGGDCP